MTQKALSREELLEIKEYIEKSERDAMWEYSSNIIEDEELYKSNRMPPIYKIVCELTKENKL